MCRNIRRLFNYEPPATQQEIEEAAVQFVRKVSGSRSPSKANVAAFERAVDDVTTATRRLLAALVTEASPRNREEDAATVRARARARGVRD